MPDCVISLILFCLFYSAKFEEDTSEDSGYFQLPICFTAFESFHCLHIDWQHVIVTIVVLLFRFGIWHFCLCAPLRRWIFSRNR